ncbi:MAG: hypothetical protein WA885_13360 [Phormidesmis sp.]
MATAPTLANALANDDSADALAADGLAQQTQQACEFLPESEPLNTQILEDEDEAVIVIGNQLDRRYRVIVRSNNPDNLAAIRACVPDAFLTRDRLGSHIRVGSFARRSEAEAMHRILRQQGYRSRVTYSR